MDTRRKKTKSPPESRRNQSSIFTILFNPFDTVRYNSKIEPDSRTLHTTLWEKFEDTFQVFDGGTGLREQDVEEIKSGQFVPKTRLNRHNVDVPVMIRKQFRFDTRPGLFDYLTLGIFRLSHFLYDFFGNFLFAEKNKAANYKGWKKAGIYIAKALTWVPFSIVGLMHIIGNGIVRHAVSAAATIVLSPIVIFSHFVSRAVGYYAAKKVAKELIVNQQSNIPLFTQQVTLYQTLGKTSLRDAIVMRDNSSTKVKFIIPQEKNPTMLKVAASGNFAKNAKGRAKLMKVNESARVEFEGHEAIKPRHR